MQNYEVLLDRIAELSGTPRDEVERKVEAKKAKLSGLISREGAAQIIAAELGVSFDNVTIKINELMPGMRKVNIIGKVIQLFPVREYEKNGRSGKVANLRIADETGNCRVVLWDVNHIALIETGNISEGDVIAIANGSTRDNEIHLSSYSELKKSKETLTNVKTQATVKEGTIVDIANGQMARLRGVIVQMFPIRYYNVCSECNKKVTQTGDTFLCAEHGEVTPSKRGILNFVLDDGTETLRCVLFSDAINKIGDELSLEDTEAFAAFKQEYLGSEVTVTGTVRRNSLFNNLELIGNDIEVVDVETLIASLEA